MKQILALPMCHKICTTMKVQAYEINSFKTGHPVCMNMKIEIAALSKLLVQKMLIKYVKLKVCRVG